MNQKNRGVSFRNVLSGVGALALLLFWTMYHANFVVGRSLLLAFPDWEVTYRRAYPLLNGDVVAYNVTLVPPGGDAANAFHFASLHVRVPLIQYYRSGFSRERRALLKSIDEVKLEFSDGHGDMSAAFSPELAAFGTVSAAPFEAEGCRNDTVWSEPELAAMGMSSRGVELTMSWQLHDGTLIREQTLAAPGVSNVHTRREIVTHDHYPLFSLSEGGRSEIVTHDHYPLFSLSEGGRSEIVADEWHVADEGFVAARNRHCASGEKITPKQFVQRHLLSVKRLLEAVALAPAPELEAAYAKYATGGGSFDVSVHYTPAIGAELQDADDLSGWLPSVRGEFTINGTPHALALTAISARALPENGNLTTYEVVEREGRTEAAPVDTAVMAPAPAPASVATAPALTATSPSTASVAASPRSASTANAARTAPVDVAAPASAAAAPTTVAVISASSMATDDAVPATMSYRDLAAHIGQFLKVYQIGHPPVVAEIVRVAENGDVLVRRRFGGGEVEFVLDRKRFDHAEP
jgi:hypothetical protein